MYIQFKLKHQVSHLLNCTVTASSLQFNQKAQDNAQQSDIIWSMQEILFTIQQFIFLGANFSEW